ncbi:uncharacterized protein LOC126905649 isoform X2 [Daktulosphaira vitifoliae]|uniref:uncharacterized protein LOC126905649 isoform X2 n=1 Tax=Daktulosphaira vitifoliae TaxID=58002 RepID=UPI0021AAD264|nr:uncharacterized protein LOC126905649 isoform X2 [Daktulosphaira vitifoliae]
MHLQTTLILFSICFFTSTKSKGLNANQLAHVKEMHWYIINDHDILQKVLKKFDIKEEYDYNPTEEKGERLDKILNFLVEVNKWGDDKNVEKLDINDVKRILTQLNKFSSYKYGLLYEEDFRNFMNNNINIFLIESKVTLNNEDMVKIKMAIRYLINDINKNRNWDYYDLGDVLLIVLKYKAECNKTKFGEINDDVIHDKLNDISKYYKANDFKAFHGE